MIVKICGITQAQDAMHAAYAGADLLGLNFWPGSPRALSITGGAAMVRQLRDAMGDDCPVLVGIFVNQSVSSIMNTMQDVGLDFAQLSGDETAEILIELRGLAYKAIRPMNAAMVADDVQYFAEHMPEDARIPSLLLDAYHAQQYGGTGQTTPDDINAAVKDKVPRLMLAGGLTPENVAERIATVQPWGVDVASGVEGDDPRTKNPERVAAFIRAAKGT